jgi:hypothetical protein
MLPGGQIEWTTVIPHPGAGSKGGGNTYCPPGCPSCSGACLVDCGPHASIAGLAVGTSGHAFVAAPWGTCGEPSYGAAGVGLFEIDPGGTAAQLQDLSWGPIPSTSFGGGPALVSFGVAGASHWTLGAAFDADGPVGVVASSTLGILSSYPDHGRLLVAGDAAGDTFAYFQGDHSPWPGYVGEGLAKYDGAGTLQWVASACLPSPDHVCPLLTATNVDLAADGAGGVYVGGALSSKYDFGCGLLPPGPFLARLGACGACLWSEALPASVAVTNGVAAWRAHGLLPTDAGQLYVTGTFQGSADLGCGPMTSVGTGSFVARLDAGGACLWSRALATGLLAVEVFPGGDLLLATSYSGAIDFGGGPIQSVGTVDHVVARLSASGAQLWSKSFGAPGASVAGTGLVADPKGRTTLSVLVQGGAVDFGAGPVAPGNVLLELDPTGALAWQRAPFGGIFASDPCGAVILASACDTCAPGNGAGISVVKLAP